MCKRLICFASFIFVFSLALAGGAKAADPNCVGWWPLNEGAGETVIDLSASAMNGTTTNTRSAGQRTTSREPTLQDIPTVLSWLR